MTKNIEECTICNNPNATKNDGFCIRCDHGLYMDSSEWHAIRFATQYFLKNIQFTIKADEFNKIVNQSTDILFKQYIEVEARKP